MTRKRPRALNIETRKTALRYLAGWRGRLGIFPGGTVSTRGAPLRPADGSGLARVSPRGWIAKSEATVVPVYFDGHNSRGGLFQLMSHLHTTLRMGLLIKEFRARVNSPVDVVIGDPIPRAALEPYARDTRADDGVSAQDDLCAQPPRPLDAQARGFEFGGSPPRPRTGARPHPRRN